jgi:hypothetical protein
MCDGWGGCRKAGWSRPQEGQGKRVSSRPPLSAAESASAQSCPSGRPGKPSQADHVADPSCANPLRDLIDRCSRQMRLAWRSARTSQVGGSALVPTWAIESISILTPNSDAPSSSAALIFSFLSCPKYASSQEPAQVSAILPHQPPRYEAAVSSTVGRSPPTDSLPRPL